MNAGLTPEGGDAYVPPIGMYAGISGMYAGISQGECGLYAGMYAGLSKGYVDVVRISRDFDEKPDSRYSDLSK